MNTIRERTFSAKRLTARFLLLAITLALICTLGVGQASAAAITTTTNVKEYIDFFVYIPCADNGAGELVELTGPLHALFVTTIDNQGGFHGKYHFQPQGVSGTGLSTGATYHATGETQEMFHGKVGIQDTYVNNFKIIGTGPGNNFLIHENIHITVNANGVVTAYVDNFKADCK